MSASSIWPVLSGPSRPLHSCGARALGVFPAIVLLLCTPLLLALETPSKPFLEKNSFYLSSPGFRLQLANDPSGQTALGPMPPHRSRSLKVGRDSRHLYAAPRNTDRVF